MEKSRAFFCRGCGRDAADSDRKCAPQSRAPARRALAKVSANATGFDLASPTIDDEELLVVDEAIQAFAVHDARKAELVKQRYFIGLTLEEAAEVLGVSVRTAKRDWAYAHAWLFNEVKRLRA